MQRVSNPVQPRGDAEKDDALSPRRVKSSLGYTSTLQSHTLDFSERTCASDGVGLGVRAISRTAIPAWTLLSESEYVCLGNSPCMGAGAEKAGGYADGANDDWESNVLRLTAEGAYRGVVIGIEGCMKVLKKKKKWL